MTAPDDPPLVRLERWSGPIDPADPDANFKADVAAYTNLDPLATVQNLAENLDLPLGAVVRYVLARWATGGSEALMELGTSAVERMLATVDRAEEDGSELAKLEAYELLKQQIQWVRHGLAAPEATYPAGGAGPRRRTRLAAYGVITDADRILLVRIAAGEPGEAQWTLPGGGLDHGEHPAEGALREILEETGLRAELGELLAIDSLHLPPERETIRGDDYHALRFVYRATVPVGAEPRDETDGSTDTARWIPLEEAARLDLVDLARLGLRLATAS